MDRSYTEDAVYWVPSWVNEEETTDDPELAQSDLSGNRGGWKIVSLYRRDSYASVP